MSIRTRLLVAAGAVALLALLAADVGTYAALRSYLYGQIDGNLELFHRAVEQSIGAGAGPPPPMSSGAPPQHCPDYDGAPVAAGGLSPGTVIELRDEAGATVYRCDIVQLGSTRRDLPMLPSHISGFVATAADPGEPATYFDAQGTAAGTSFRVRASMLRGGRDSGGELIVASPLGPTDGILSDLVTLELVVTACALVLALLLGWWLVRASLRPLRDIETTADAITAGQLAERVPADHARTEVGRVARAFNVMLERIQEAFAERDRKEADLRASEARMRQFVADASHELRTPLAAVRAYAELFDRLPAEHRDDVRRIVHGVQRESLRMSDLVEDLLLLARLDEGRPMRVERVDLAAVATDAVVTARELGPEWPIRLEAASPVDVRGDTLRLRQVLDNLLKNVRDHCPPGTDATVEVTQEGSDALVVVTDSGPGFDADPGRLFERFFREESSRSRDHGGAGLGLAIVAAVAAAHGGLVVARNAPGAGAQFQVRLPLWHRDGAAQSQTATSEPGRAV